MKEKHTELSLLVEQVILGESEQLDELKKSTLINYGRKAGEEADKKNAHASAALTAAGEYVKDDKPGIANVYIDSAKDDMKKAKKRKEGITTAAKKIVSGQYQESILDQLSDAIEYLDEDQIQIVAEMVVELMEASYDRELDPKKPIIVHGVKGMKSTPFKKKFKNMDAYDKWTDSDEYGNHEVHTVQNQDQYNEDVEQIDELKASTLGSYIGKGDKDLDRLSRKKWDMIIKSHGMSPEEIEKTRPEYDETKRKEGNRKKGVKTALAKFAKGEYDERNSYDPSRYDESLIDQLSDAIEYLDEDQIQLVAEMVVELLEMEQIDELKKETLGSYIKKASDDSVNAAHDLGKVRERSDEVDRFTNRLHTGFKERDEIKKMLKATPSDEREKLEKAAKRVAGIKTAVDKLTKGQYQEEYIEEALSELITGVVLDEAPGVKRASKSEVEPYSVGTFVNTPFGGGRITHFKEGNSIRPHQYRVLLPKTKNTHPNKERYSPWVGHGAVSKPSEG